MAILYDVLNPFAINVGALYMQYSLFFDAIMALFLFLSLGMFVFKAKYKASDGKATKEGKLIGVAVGLVLTFAFTVWELTTGWRFGNLAPLAALIFMFILGVFIYSLLSEFMGENKKQCAFAITYLLIYGFFFSTRSGDFNYILQRYELIGAVLSLLMIVALIRFIICIFSGFGGGGSSTTPPGPTPTPGPTPQPPRPDPRLPLEVVFEEPRQGQRCTEGTDIPLRALIRGGDDPVIWDFAVQGHNDYNAIRNSRQGTGRTASATATLPAGNWTLVIEARDRNTRAHAYVQITVDPKPGLWKVSIRTPRADAPHDANAVRNLGESRPIIVTGVVESAPHPRCYYVFGIYDTNQHLLGNPVVHSPEQTCYTDVPVGTNKKISVDCTHIQTTAGPSVLGQGEYVVGLFAYKPEPGWPIRAPPLKYTDVPREQFAGRVIQVAGITATIVEPATDKTVAINDPTPIVIKGEVDGTGSQNYRHLYGIYDSSGILIEEIVNASGQHPVLPRRHTYAVHSAAGLALTALFRHSQVGRFTLVLVGQHPTGLTKLPLTLSEVLRLPHDKKELIVVSPSGGRFEIIVKDADNRAIITGATVVVTNAARQAQSVVTTLNSAGEEEHVTNVLPAGQYTLAALHTGYTPALQHENLGNAVMQVTILLTPTGAPLPPPPPPGNCPLVVEARRNNAYLPGVDVTVKDASNNVIGSGQTNNGGRCYFALLSSGQVTVEATLNGAPAHTYTPSQQVVLTPTAQQTVIAEFGSKGNTTVNVFCVDALKNPVTNANVTITDASGSQHGAHVNVSTGLASFANVAAGILQLLEGDSTTLGKSTNYKPKPADIPASGTYNVTITFGDGALPPPPPPTSGSVRFKCINKADGKPVTDAAVEFTDVNGKQHNDKVDKKTGERLFTNIPVGALSAISATSSALSSTTMDHDPVSPSVTASATTDVTIYFDKKFEGVVEITCIDTAKQPVTDATIHFNDAAGNQVPAQTVDTSGTAKFVPVMAGAISDLVGISAVLGAYKIDQPDKAKQIVRDGQTLRIRLIFQAKLKAWFAQPPIEHKDVAKPYVVPFKHKPFPVVAQAQGRGFVMAALYDSNGQLARTVARERFDTSVTIKKKSSLDKLPPGIYMLVLYASEQPFNVPKTYPKDPAAQPAIHDWRYVQREEDLTPAKPQQPIDITIRNITPNITEATDEAGVALGYRIPHGLVGFIELSYEITAFAPGHYQRYRISVYAQHAGGATLVPTDVLDKADFQVRGHVNASSGVEPLSWKKMDKTSYGAIAVKPVTTRGVKQLIIVLGDKRANVSAWISLSTHLGVQVEALVVILEAGLVSGRGWTSSELLGWSTRKPISAFDRTQIIPDRPYTIQPHTVQPTTPEAPNIEESGSPAPPKTAATPSATPVDVAAVPRPSEPSPAPRRSARGKVT